MPTTPDLSKELAQSASTDIAVLLSAKEQAKRQVMDNATPANLAAYDKASKMLDAAQSAKASMKDAKAVLVYIEESGRKVGKTKLYDDITRGRLKKQADGTFKLRDVDRYAASLPNLGTGDTVAQKAADRQRRKEEGEIRRIEAAAKRDELKLRVEEGRYISREQVFQELAGRAVTLASGLKTAFESKAQEIIYEVEGNPKKVQNFMHMIEEMMDATFNEYASIDEFVVMFTSHADTEQEDEEIPEP